MDLKESPNREFVRHPWELARFAFFRRVLKEAGLDRAPLQILDVGSGDAWFAKALVASLPAGTTCTCWDIGYQEQALPSAFSDSRLTATQVRPGMAFDLILLLDVAEHVEDDRSFLIDLVAHCARSGTHVLFSVPAWSALMCSHDVALHHFRRYQPSQARALLKEAGLTLQSAGGAFHGLILPRLVNVLKERVFGAPKQPVAESLEWQAGNVLGNVVGQVLAAEGRTSRWLASNKVDLPGLSWWALCQK